MRSGILQRTLVIVLGALFTMTAAFINGYPLVYDDTATYIISGFELVTPFDRPIFYGLFLWLSSFGGASLWWVVFFQGLLLSYLVYLLLERLLPDPKRINSYFLVVMLLLSLLSSASWTSSQLLADAFTPIAFLSFLVLILGQLSRATVVVVYIIFFISIATHMSHVTIFTLLILLVMALRKFNVLRGKDWIGLRPLVICLVLTLGSMLTMGSAMSKSKHAFMMGAFIEHGIIDEFLADNCADSEYQLCRFQGSLPPTGIEFLWHKTSPFYQVGGWGGSREEFNAIIWETFTTPKYIWLHIKASFWATLDQLSQFTVGSGNGVFQEGTAVHERVNKYFFEETLTFEGSLQNQGVTGFIAPYNQLLSGTVYASLLLLIWSFFRHTKVEIKGLILLCLLAVFVNAQICGTLANAIPRLGARMIWLVPFAALLLLAHDHAWKSYVEGKTTSTR